MKPTPRTARGFDNVYDPSEDSFFLIDCLEKEEQFLQRFACPTVLELGTGTGIVSSFVPQLVNKYVPVATDVSPLACQCAAESWRLNWPGSSLEVVRGDLLSFWRAHTVDVLLFNPPYVPTERVPERPTAETDDRWVDLALDGGADGMEITNVVLDQLDTCLSPNGVAYILFIAGNHPETVCKNMNARGWLAVHIDTRRAGREVLSVYRFSRAQAA